jgi:hypothetical protein
MKKILAILAIAGLLSGCASTKFDKLGVQERTMKIGNIGALGIVLYESSTTGFDAAGVDVKKSSE